MMKAITAAMATGAAALTLIGAPVAHADPGAGCSIDNNYLRLASTVPGLAITPILGPHSIESAGQLVATLAAQGYTVELISTQVARDLHVDTITAAALMGYTGCEID